MLVFKKTFDNTNNPAFIYEKFDSKSFIKSCKISIQQLYSLLLRTCQFDVYIYIYIYRQEKYARCDIETNKRRKLCVQHSL